MLLSDECGRLKVCVCVCSSSVQDLRVPVCFTHDVPLYVLAKEQVRDITTFPAVRITGTSVTLWGTHTHCFAHMCWRVSWPCEARADICSIRSELGEEGGDLPTAQGCQRRDRRVCPRQQLGRTLTRPNLGEWVRSPPARWLPARMPRPPHPPDTPPAGQDREGQRPLVSLHLGFSEARGGQ